MKKVTKEEYYNYFNNLDAICNVDSSNGYPYREFWTLRGKRDIIAESIPIKGQYEKYDYFIKQQ